MQLGGCLLAGAGQRESLESVTFTCFTGTDKPLSKCILESMSKLTSPQTLGLGGLELGGNGLAQLLHCLRCQRYLEVLDMSGNKLDEQGFRRNDLRREQFQGVVAVAGALEQFTALHTLHVTTPAVSSRRRESHIAMHRESDIVTLTER